MIKDRLYFRMLVVTPIVVALLLFLKFFFKTEEHFLGDVSSVGGYLTVIGTHYSILTAFIIFVVWEQFNKASDAVDREVNDLKDLLIFVQYMDDKRAEVSLRKAVGEYADSVISEEWEVLQNGGRSLATENKFREIFKAIKDLELNDAKDPIAWKNIIEKYNDISDSRETRIVTSTQRLPQTLKILLYLVSFSVVVGFFLLGIKDNFIASAITALTTTVVLLVIEVIQDLDDPFTGKWAIKTEDFKMLQDTEKARTQMP